MADTAELIGIMQRAVERVAHGDRDSVGLTMDLQIIRSVADVLTVRLGTEVAA